MHRQDTPVLHVKDPLPPNPIARQSCCGGCGGCGYSVTLKANPQLSGQLKIQLHRKVVSAARSDPINSDIATDITSNNGTERHGEQYLSAEGDAQDPREVKNPPSVSGCGNLKF